MRAWTFHTFKAGYLPFGNLFVMEWIPKTNDLRKVRPKVSAWKFATHPRKRCMSVYWKNNQKPHQPRPLTISKLCALYL